MIAYTTIGVKDLDQAKAFYLALLEELGGSVFMDTGRLAALGTPQGGAMLAVCTPYDEGEPNPGNGNMVAIAPGSTELVDKLYARALELGGSDEGAPGPRGEADENGNVFYAAYFRDRDGNKLNAFCMVPQG